MKTLTYVVWVITGLPLIIYPFAAISAWEILMNSSYSPAPAFDRRLGIVVAILSLLYPAFFALGLFLSRAKIKAGLFESGVKLSLIPVAYLCLVIGIGAYWTAVETKSLEIESPNNVKRP